MGLPTSTARLESKLLLPQQTEALIYVGTARYLEGEFEKRIVPS